MPVTAEDLARCPSGVDVTLIIENLRLAPTERLEKMLRFLEFVQELRRANGIRTPPDPRGSR
jgi:hypothetical protein